MVSLRLAVVLITAVCAGGCAPAQGKAQAAPAPAGFIKSGEVRLSYRLDMPAGPGPHPAVVLGHGSGRITKDDQLGIAGGMIAHGYAVLSYDKRGAGESTGEYSGVGPKNSDRMFGLLSDDMAAAARFLQSQPGIDPRRVGFMGVSQAGWIVPLAATKADVRFIILVSGPTVSVGEEIFYSDIVEDTAAPLEDGYRRLPEFTGPRGFEVRPILERVNVPGLWLFGADDRSIPVRNSVAILQDLAARGRPFKSIVYPDQGHGLHGFWNDVYTWLDALKL